MVDLPSFLDCAKPEHMALTEGVFLAGKNVGWVDEKVKYEINISSLQIVVTFSDYKHEAWMVVLSTVTYRVPFTIGVMVEWYIEEDDGGMHGRKDRKEWFNFEDPNVFDDIALYVKKLINRRNNSPW